MKKKISDSGKSKYILIAISLLCCIMIFLTFTTDMNAGPLRYITGYVIAPIQSGINKVGAWISEKGVYFQDSSSIAAENKELQEKVDTLTAENTQLLQDKDELDRLRDLYEIDHRYDDYEKVGARVIAKDSGNWFNVFTIDKGSNDGIQKDMNVMAPGGLVGIVTDVSANWSTVRSIIDDYSNVSAMVTSTNDRCIIAGDLRLIDEGKINLVQLTDKNDKVTVGDKVVTSNISDRYLPGILIGYICEIGMDSNNLTKSGAITPAVDFAHLQEVLVIKELKDVDDAKASINSQSETESDMKVETESAETEENESESGGTGTPDPPSPESDNKESQ